MKVISAILSLLLLLAIFSKPILHFATLDTVTDVVITDKERVPRSNSSRFMIWTKDEVFENTDTLWGWKFDSADIQGKMLVGETCSLEVTGWRVPFLSWNRNILSATCVKTG